MGVIEYIKDNVWIVHIVMSILVALVCLVIYSIIDRFVSKKLINKDLKVLDEKKYLTFIKLVKSISKYVLIILAVVIILQINGIDVSSMLAGIGVISLVIGFAIQDWLKDIIRGLSILSDSYYKVGDVIKFNNNTGKVLSIGLSTTKIQDIYSNNIVSIANRNIDKVEIESTLINIDVPLPYELKLNEAEEAINNIVDKIKNNSKVDNVEYRGVNNLDDSCIKYQIKVYCLPEKKVQIRRDSLRCVLEGLEEMNISVPYNQLDIHNK